uniref:Albumin domain-containing protein n=1 Tax=Hucho hucho TaxID=62062 RepID=A0A4W5JX30_9TELE
MQWLSVCSLLVLLSVSAPSQAQNQICTIFTEIKEDGFKSLILVGLAQNLPDSTLGDMVPLIAEALAMGVKCCSDTPPEDCDRDVADLFQSAVCSSETLVEKNHLKMCCEKTAAERTHCFVDHKAKVEWATPPSEPGCYLGFFLLLLLALWGVDRINGSKKALLIHLTD